MEGRRDEEMEGGEGGAEVEGREEWEGRKERKRRGEIEGRDGWGDMEGRNGGEGQTDGERRGREGGRIDINQLLNHYSCSQTA